MPYTLAPLPYPSNALEPHMDARTVEIHHDKHHAAYVANLNKALEKYPALASKSIEELVSNLAAVPEDIRTAVRNNGGGTLNHNLYWELLAANAGGQPTGDLAKAIEKSPTSAGVRKNGGMLYRNAPKPTTASTTRMIAPHFRYFFISGLRS